MSDILDITPQPSLPSLVARALSCDQLAAYEKLTGFPIKLGKKYLSVFVSEKTPSMLFRFDGGRIRFHCYSSGKFGDIIDMVCYVHGYDTVGACKYIIENHSYVANIAKPIDNVVYTYDYQLLDLNAKIAQRWLDYWREHGVSLYILRKLKILPIYKAESIAKGIRRQIAFYRLNGVYNIVIGNPMSDGRVQIYQPYNKECKFRTPTDTRNASFEPIFNADCLLANPYKDTNIVFITSSMKDVACIMSRSYASFAPLSESTLVSYRWMRLARLLYKHIVVLYDNDITGRDKANDMKEEYPHVHLYFVEPLLVENTICKDPANLARCKDKDLLKEFLDKINNELNID